MRFLVFETSHLSKVWELGLNCMGGKTFFSRIWMSLVLAKSFLRGIWNPGSTAAPDPTPAGSGSPSCSDSPSTPFILMSKGSGQKAFLWGVLCGSWGPRPPGLTPKSRQSKAGMDDQGRFTVLPWERRHSVATSPGPEWRPLPVTIPSEKAALNSPCLLGTGTTCVCVWLGLGPPGYEEQELLCKISQMKRWQYF